MPEASWPPLPLPSDAPFPAGGLWPPTGPLSFPPPPRRWPPGRLRGPPLPQGFSSYTRAAARLLRGGLHTYIHTYIHTHCPSLDGVWVCTVCFACYSPRAAALSALPVRLNRRAAGSPRGAHRSSRGPRRATHSGKRGSPHEGHACAFTRVSSARDLFIPLPIHPTCYRAPARLSVRRRVVTTHPYVKSRPRTGRPPSLPRERRRLTRPGDRRLPSLLTERERSAHTGPYITPPLITIRTYG